MLISPYFEAGCKIRLINVEKGRSKEIEGSLDGFCAWTLREELWILKGLVVSRCPVIEIPQKLLISWCQVSTDPLESFTTKSLQSHKLKIWLNFVTSCQCCLFRKSHLIKAITVYCVPHKKPTVLSYSLLYMYHQIEIFSVPCENIIFLKERAWEGGKQIVFLWESLSSQIQYSFQNTCGSHLSVSIWWFSGIQPFFSPLGTKQIWRENFVKQHKEIK